MKKGADPAQDGFVRQSVEAAIRIGVVALIVVWSLRIISPFLEIVLWAIILAVAVAPLHANLARRLGGRGKLAAVLILAVAQVPPLLVLGPVMVWALTTQSTVAAVIFVVYGLLVSVSDTFLKPLLLGRGVDVPMMVILLGAIGGMVHSGIIGLFVGAVVLAVAYQLMMAWLEQDADRGLLPATGPGLVLALAYFHPQKEGVAPSHGDSKAPPTTTFGAAAGTTNGTWFVAGGHHHVWKEDSIRYLGAIGGGSVNLTFYGFGDDDLGENDGRDFNIELFGTVQQVKFRIGDSPVFVGAKYVFAATETTFETQGENPLEGDANLAGLSGVVEYDTRDTVFTPNEGLQTTLELSWFSEALGGDFDYAVGRLDFRYYWSLGKTWVLGFRGDFDAVGDEAPFFALPWVKFRGVPAFRYLGNYVVTVEVEPRYKIDERWSVVGFAGAGRAATEISNLNDADKVYGIGGGFRYLIAKKLGMGIGIDIARGPEETVGYLTIGSAW